jgi:hypothetical protein
LRGHTTGRWFHRFTAGSRLALLGGVLLNLNGAASVRFLLAWWYYRLGQLGIRPWELAWPVAVQERPDLILGFQRILRGRRIILAGNLRELDTRVDLVAN